MEKVFIIFPHQLIQDTSFLERDVPVYLVEEVLFFRQYNFHKQKLAFHRATMKFYEQYLIKKGIEVNYIESGNPLSDCSSLIEDLIKKGLKELMVIDPVDNWLERKIDRHKNDVSITLLDSPLFINTKSELQPFFSSEKKKFFQTTFYKNQRIQRNILIENGQPVGGKWTFDAENRKKYPKNKIPPSVSVLAGNEYWVEAVTYIETHFSVNCGSISKEPFYPTTFQESESWLQSFFEWRFDAFGAYEDAIVANEHFLHHSVLSPLINVGLLSPTHVLHRAIEYAQDHDIPINSLEGFVRQILGWREFIRGVYQCKGSEERTRNFWNCSRKIPKSFYDGTTGILPIDNAIKKILKTGYAHHIERLMVLGNFMLLCGFDPDDVYQWFMSLFIDAYDWVMVPNVYGMTLFADGGIMSTKPYIGSSNYIKKMSNYPSGDWQNVWDGLFWRFMDKHRVFLSKNPRLKMLIGTLDRMDVSKREQLFSDAEGFLNELDRQVKQDFKHA